MRVRHHHHGASAPRTNATVGVGARDEGVALIEFALVVFLLITLVFGALDIGFRWRYSHEAVGASRAGARIGARLGTDRTTDLNVLSTVRTSLDSVDMLDSLERVIVYRADSSNGRPPLSCTHEFGPSGPCNVYPASALTSPPADSNFDADGCMITGATYQNYCPDVRDVDQRDADYVGVMVVLRVGSITGMYSDSTVQRYSVMRMEPTAK